MPAKPAPDNDIKASPKYQCLQNGGRCLTLRNPTFSLHLQFLLANVLCLDPDLFDLWMKERGLPLHQSLSQEPIVPRLRLKELQATESVLNSELTKLFNEAGIYQPHNVSVYVPKKM